jgi:ribosomal protein L6P/L9E
MFSNSFKNTYFYVSPSKIIAQNQFGILSFFVPDIFFFQLRKKLYQNFFGASIGFLFNLKIKGVGFKAKIIKMYKKFFLCLNIGYNHDINIQIPSGIRVSVVKGTSLIVSSKSFFSLKLFCGFVKKLKNVH